MIQLMYTISVTEGMFSLNELRLRKSRVGRAAETSTDKQTSDQNNVFMMSMKHCIFPFMHNMTYLQVSVSPLATPLARTLPKKVSREHPHQH